MIRFTFGLHCGDDMGGIRGVCKASRTAAGADALLIEEQQQCLGFNAVEGDVGGVGEPLGGVSVAFCIGDGREESFLQSIAQGADGGVVGGKFLQRVSRSRAEANEMRDVLRAAAPGALLMSAMNEGNERSFLLNIEPADAFRSADLVAGEGEVVDG